METAQLKSTPNGTSFVWLVSISVPKAVNKRVFTFDLIIRQLSFVVFTDVFELLLLFLFKVNVVSASHFYFQGLSSSFFLGGGGVAF